MEACFRGLITAVALCACATTHAAGPTGGVYQITQSTIASGVGGMTGGAYVVSSSLGDLSRAPIGASTSIWHAGFWSGLAGAVAILPTCVLDIDDDGRIDALTDGVVLLRAMNGLTGSSVIANAIGPGAKRTTWPQIQSAINLPSLDIDGDGSTSAQTDGLLLIRSMFGLTGAAVTQGATGSGAQRDKWSDIRSFLNTNCGTSFAQ